MEATKSSKKEKVLVVRARSPEDFRKIVKIVHDDSTDLGDVTGHTTLESKVDSPLKTALVDWDDASGIEPEGQKSTRNTEYVPSTLKGALKCGSLKYAPVTFDCYVLLLTLLFVVLVQLQ